MIVLLGLLVYALMGLVCMVFFTYLDAKYTNNSEDNCTIIEASIIWPISLLIFIANVVVILIDHMITYLRVYFQQNKE